MQPEIAPEPADARGQPTEVEKTTIGESQYE
jgi:hypothetical protein